MKYLLRLSFALVLIAGVSACSAPDPPSVPDGLEIDWMEGAAATAEEVHPLLPGMMAPSFSLLQADSSEYVFDADQLQKPAIIVFYRGGWCPYCSRQLVELRTIDDKLAEMGYELLFISADSPARLSEGSIGDDVPFTLLSDNRMEVSKSFGIAYRVDDETITRYLKGGLDLAEEAGYGHYLLPAPSVFVIDVDGLIQFQYTNPNYRVRVSSELLLTAARISLQANG